MRRDLGYPEGMDIMRDIAPARPVLIAGPTATGKSALALAIARAQGGIIVNADAIQVYENWHVLSARPEPEEVAQAPHRLYGHVGARQDYSVGHWLREMSDIVRGPDRPIITGGTGLYFAALTEGLAEIPATPPGIRQEADERVAAEGLGALLDVLDPDTRARIDTRNPKRVQRAWEVQRTTGRGLAAWQDTTPAPLLSLDTCQPLLMTAETGWLNARIARRFDRMLDAGALDEVRANLDTWDPVRPSSRAIGAAELVAYLRGETTLDEAREAATIATRQFAKRQRTWFRARMRSWRRIAADEV
ncbi:tRNA (adenosine(37)-N6)-dimethylallyltransferase MiaA [Roseovarius tibetensis]|uniref:tRNA (adenosine(37)-N6)-dimethylallyltransferase MiaA n=1 Tax=Roseovarius tibetensis TaxID=2685897 RepID=UPI003D7F8E7E